MCMKKNRLSDLVRLMRPAQWMKNGFVFTGFLFGEQLYDVNLLLRVMFAAIAFCCVSSCIYIINDIVDCNTDKVHPSKQNRPLPSGLVTTPCAIRLASLLGVLGLFIGFQISFEVTLILMLYALLNVFYTFQWKHIVIVDVFCISAGFMLRIMAGTIGVDIPPSKWLLLCGMMITLFLGFAKRRAEVISLANHKKGRRKVLESYSSTFLDEVLAICATGVVLAYSLYTMSEETVHVHDTANLIYTVPFVVYGLFRYLFLLHHHHVGEDPTKDLIKDPHIVVVVIGWAMLSFYFMYLT